MGNRTIDSLLGQIDLRLTALNGLRAEQGQPPVAGPTKPEFTGRPNQRNDAQHAFAEYLRKFRAGLDKQIDSTKSTPTNATSIFPTADELSGTLGDPAHLTGGPDVAQVLDQTAGGGSGPPTLVKGLAVAALIWLLTRLFK